MHRRSFLLFVLSAAMTAGCSHARRPATAVSPAAGVHDRQLSQGTGRHSLGAPSVPAEGRECPGGLTANECALVDSAVIALQNHPAARCRAAGDSARARLYRGQLELVQRTLVGPGMRGRPDQSGVAGPPGDAWIGANQFDRRGVLMEAMARALVADSLRLDSAAAVCRRSEF